MLGNYLKYKSVTSGNSRTNSKKFSVIFHQLMNCNTRRDEQETNLGKKKKKKILLSRSSSALSRLEKCDLTSSVSANW